METEPMLPSNRITPRYRLMMRYDIRLDTYQNYMQYVMNEFVPALQSMGVYMSGVWQTAYGNYPLRQIEFVVEDLNTLREVFRSDRWKQLEEELKSYTLRYERKLVAYEDRFQF
jgi:hypothetical protein